MSLVFANMMSISLLLSIDSTFFFVILVSSSVAATWRAWSFDCSRSFFAFFYLLGVEQARTQQTRSTMAEKNRGTGNRIFIVTLFIKRRTGSPARRRAWRYGNRRSFQGSLVRGNLLLQQLVKLGCISEDSPRRIELEVFFLFCLVQSKGVSNLVLYRLPTLIQALDLCKIPDELGNLCF